MSQHERAARLTTIGLAAFLVIAAYAGAATGTPDEPGLKQTTGTVSAIEPEAARISVITGCGHALRVMVFQADAACRIEIDGIVGTLAHLRRGRIVTVRYKSGPEPCAAESIATIPSPDVGRRK